MSNEESIRNHFKKLRSLVQYKTKSDEELWQIAKDSVTAIDPDLQVDFVDDKTERKLAKELLEKYIQAYSVTNVSDKNLIKQVVYLEVVQTRLQNELNKIKKKDASTPIRIVEALQKNLESIAKTKISLGLVQNADGQDKTAQALELLKRKAKTWREENQGSRTLICPHCSKMTLLKIRTDKYEAGKHPFFKDRILYNKHLIQLYKTNAITKDDVAQILGTSPDYIDWLMEKIQKGSLKD